MGTHPEPPLSTSVDSTRGHQWSLGNSNPWLGDYSGWHAHSDRLPECTSFPALCLLYAHLCVHPPHMLALLLTYRSNVYSVEPSMAPAAYKASGASFISQAQQCRQPALPLPGLCIPPLGRLPSYLAPLCHPFLGASQPLPSFTPLLLGIPGCCFDSLPHCHLHSSTLVTAISVCHWGLSRGQ